MGEWLTTQTVTGATYLQVIILASFTIFVAAPLAYIVIRDMVRTIKDSFFENDQEQRH